MGKYLCIISETFILLSEAVVACDHSWYMVQKKWPSVIHGAHGSHIQLRWSWWSVPVRPAARHRSLCIDCSNSWGGWGHLLQHSLQMLAGPHTYIEFALACREYIVHADTVSVCVDCLRCEYWIKEHVNVL